MIQHKAPKYILLISGGISGTTDEILKYSPERIDYLELNPWLTKIAKHYNPNLSNPVINIINRDAILFLKEKNKEPETDLYDVALVNVPPPNSAQLNRFYTIEFFRLLKKHLADDAVISISLPSTADYVTPEARRLNSSLYSTLSKTFKNILIVPGNKNYFIASDSNLNINIADMIQHSAFNIQNTYVNQYYLDDYLLKQRSDFIKSKIVNHTSEINTDFSPVAYYLQLRYWLSLFKITNYKLLITIFILCLAFCIIFLFLFNIQHSLFNINFSLFTTGFAASSLQFLLLVYFQVFYGYVYMMTGILITLFMFGLAAGTFISGFRFPAINMKNFTRLNFGLGIYSIAIPLILYLLKNYNISSVIIQIIFFIIIIDIGTLTGMIFAFAVKLQNDTVSAIASRSYSIDLLGSAIGVLLVSAFFLPLFGLVNVSLLVASLCLLSGLILILSKKKV
jgi:spermidine synthase